MKIEKKHLLDYHVQVERGQYERLPAADWLLRCLGKKAVVERETLLDQGLTGSFDYDKCTRKLLELGALKLYESTSLIGHQPDATFCWEDTLVSLGVHSKSEAGQSGEMRLCSTNEAKFLELFSAFRPLFTKIKQQGQVYILVPSRDGGLEVESIGMANTPLETDNYRPEVIEGFNQIVHDISAKDPSGRLSILNGIPGSGKTYLVRSLIGCSEDAMFVLLPANMTADLSGPTLISCLTNLKEKDKTVVLIIEDADTALSRRGSDNISAISTLLNASDGIIGHLINIRIICTTNADIEDFDPAITRPGRLSANIEVGLLEPDHASKVFKRLTGEDRSFKKLVSLAEVYSLAKKGKTFNFETPKRTVGFAFSKPVGEAGEPYIFEDRSDINV